MTLRINDQSQAADLAAELTSSGTQAASGSSQSTAAEGLNGGEDTTSLSSAPSQLTGDVEVRQDRVDALRAQVESGTYTVDARAVATAMMQNLFRS